MTIKEPSQNNPDGVAQEVDLDPEKILPGTTFPQTNGKSGSPDEAAHISPKSQPGPMINNRPTTVTLYQSEALKFAEQIPKLHDLINDAFDVSHATTGVLPDSYTRLESHEQLTQELSGKSTFTYVITNTDTSQVIGTASAKRYKDTLERTAPCIERPRTCFMRTGTSGRDTEGWELASMAVDPTLQRKGLAGLLIELVEGEVKRRFVAAKKQDEAPQRRLVMLLTTIKEVNLQFYSRRGYGLDYETYQEPGWYGSLTGFRVVHMSKQLDA